MSSPHDRRRQALAILLAGAALAGAARADDGVALLELSIDGRPTRQVARFVVRDGVPHASIAEWRALGLGVSPRSADAALVDAGELVPVSALPGVSAAVDLRSQTLALGLPPDPSALSVIGGPVAPLEPVADNAVGGLLNYDLGLQRDPARALGAGLLAARLFGPAGVLDHALLVSSATQPHAVRLDTTFTHSDPNQLRRVRVGDFINVGLGWTRPVRLLGVQAMTDFGLRPDLVTVPMPQLAGTAAVPSTVDVLVNGVRQLSQGVEAGRFEVRQVPVVSGLGEVSVVVRDALGRERVQTLPFYASLRQLAPGLSAYSLEAGRVRHRYGLASNDYGGFAGSASLRHGISNALTLEAHAEATPGTALAGAGGVLNLGRWGVASATLAASRGAGHTGGLASLGFERQTQTLSVNASVTRTSAGYRDIAAVQGDPAPRRSARLAAGLNLGSAGSLGLVMVDMASAGAGAWVPAVRSRIASTTYNVPIGASAQLFVTAYRDLSAQGGRGASISVSIPFGGRGGAAVSVASDRMGSGLSLQASQSAVAAGDAGWRLQADQRLSGMAQTRQVAQAEFLAPAARVSAEVEHAAGGAIATRFNLQGSLLALGGRLRAALPINDSVAVVGVDRQAGVAVYHENRFVGRTDEAGQLVVPGLLSFHTNHFAIEPLDLPLDADVGVLRREVRPGDRTAVVVRFPVERSRSALVVLHDAAGAPLPLGARATLAGGMAPFVVGHDGQAWLRGLSETNALSVTWGTGRGTEAACVARFAYASLDARTGQLGPVRCE